MTGLDSAFGPNAAQAAAIKLWVPPPWPDGTPRDAPGWWLGYCGERSRPDLGQYGAFNVWTPTDVAVVRDAGFIWQPCFVPLCWRGLILPTANPERDAELVAMTLVTVYHVEGVIELDTEHSMGADPWTFEYEARFTAHVNGPIGWQAVTYAGAFSFANPPTGVPHWIWPGKAAPRSARQSVGGTVEGLDFDLDSAGDGFPLARYV